LLLAQQFLPQYCRDLELGKDTTLAHPSFARCSPDAVTNQLTLHGLWPNYAAGFPACCNTTSTANRPLDPESFYAARPSLMKRLREAWPDPVQSTVKEGLCYLHNHEFQKHGYCYGGGFVEGDVEASAAAYFEAALSLSDKLKAGADAVLGWAQQNKVVSLAEMEALYPKKPQVYCSATQPGPPRLAAVMTCWGKGAAAGTAGAQIDCKPPGPLGVLAPCPATGILVQGRTSGVSELKLEGLLVVSRHGVRTPFPLPGGTEAYSQSPRDWSDTGATPFPSAAWGAPGIGYLTDHGKKVLTAFGSSQRQRWVEDAAFLPKDCKGARDLVTLYADNDGTTERDYRTTLAFMEGLFPGCNITVNRDASYVQPLFNDGSHPIQAGCEKPTTREYLGTMGGNARYVAQVHEEWAQELSTAIDCCKPSLCGGVVPCNIMNLTVEKGPSFSYWAPWSGGSWSAGPIAEYIQMMYLNGMEWTKVAPATSEDTLLRKLLLPHTWIMDFAWNDAFTKHYVADLGVHLAATASNILEKQPVPGLLSRPTDRLVYYAGHDSNLAMLRRMLRLSYTVRSWNENQYGTGQMLEIELLRANETGYVRLFETAMSYPDQRAGAVTGPDPVSRVFVVIPGCSHGPESTCPLVDFKALVLREVDASCATTVNPSVLEPAGGNDLNLTAGGVGGIVLACLFAGVLTGYLFGNCRHSDGTKSQEELDHALLGA